MPARRGRVSAGRRPVHSVTPPAPGTVLTWRPGGAALGADKYEKPLSHVPVFEAALPPVMGINWNCRQPESALGLLGRQFEGHDETRLTLAARNRAAAAMWFLWNFVKE